MIYTVYCVDNIVGKTVDKYGDKDRRGWTDQSVSPYLMRPLRSLARVLASRTARQDGTADRDLDSLEGESRAFPPGPGSARPVTE